MKTIRAFVFVVIPVICAACATQQPRTISALPEPPTAQGLQQLQRLPNGNYPGYQRIMVNGQEQFCRQTTRSSQSESRVACLTEAQLRTGRLLALEQEDLLQRQLQQSQELWDQYGTWPTTVAAGQPMVANLPNSR
jgi:hypothetical protein